LETEGGEEERKMSNDIMLNKTEEERGLIILCFIKRERGLIILC
jgi:hypothetical protein